MIICPNCKEEIDDDSRFCDQCGQALVYCSNCGRVGMGRRCTHCGGLMVSFDELKQQNVGQHTSVAGFVSQNYVTAGTVNGNGGATSQPLQQSGVPMLTLYNPSLDIRIVGINGAMIGRRQGPYRQLFENHLYVSGVHAQLIYNNDTGWCIIDKHSSNGTKLNQRDLQPDIPMSIKSGDIVTIANINLQVSVN